MSRDVLYMGTRNVYHQMPAAIWSLLKHTPSIDRVFLMVEDDEVPQMLPDPRIHTINVSNQTLFPETGPNYKNWWAWIVLLRVALPKFLPDDVEQVLSMDNDTVVFQDLSDLWDIPMGDNVMAMALDIESMQWPGCPYFNGGICMHNLKEERKLTDRWIKMMNTDKFKYPEQDLFSKTCRGRIIELPREYNVMPAFLDEVKNPKVIHYAGVKHHENFLWVQKYHDEAMEIIENGKMPERISG